MKRGLRVKPGILSSDAPTAPVNEINAKWYVLHIRVSLLPDVAQVPRPLWGQAMDLIADIYRAWEGGEFDESLGTVGKGKTFFRKFTSIISRTARAWRQQGLIKTTLIESGNF